MTARNYGQHCGVVTAVELVGERWALLIVRDLLVGPRRYTDLKAGLPRIPTNILSARLKELQESGVIRRVPLKNCGLVYELTEFGRGLDDIVLALGRWGFLAMGDPGEGEVITDASMTMAFRAAFRPDAASALPSARYEVHVGRVALLLDVDGGRLVVEPLSSAVPAASRLTAREPDLRIAAGPGIHRVISGEVSPEQAVAQGIVRILDGDDGMLRRFARTFRIDRAGVAERPYAHVAVAGAAHGASGAAAHPA